MSAEQLNLWEVPTSENTIIWEAITDLKLKQNHLRRGVFSRYDDILEEIAILRAEIAQLKANNQKFISPNEEAVCVGHG